MVLDDKQLSVESDCSGKSYEHKEEYAHGSDGMRQRVGVHEIWDDSWGRRQPTHHGRWDRSRCQAHNFIVQDKLLNVSR